MEKTLKLVAQNDSGIWHADEHNQKYIMCLQFIRYANLFTWSNGSQCSEKKVDVTITFSSSLARLLLDHEQCREIETTSNWILHTKLKLK